MHARARERSSDTSVRSHNILSVFIERLERRASVCWGCAVVSMPAAAGCGCYLSTDLISRTHLYAWNVFAPKVCVITIDFRL